MTNASNHRGYNCKKWLKGFSHLWKTCGFDRSVKSLWNQFTESEESWEAQPIKKITNPSSATETWARGEQQHPTSESCFVRFSHAHQAICKAFCVEMVTHEKNSKRSDGRQENVVQIMQHLTKRGTFTLIIYITLAQRLIFLPRVSREDGHHSHVVSIFSANSQSKKSKWVHFPKYISQEQFVK